jgi:HK97 family phage portal protein
MAHPWNWKRPWASLFARRWLRDPTLARLFGSGANTFAGVGVSEDSALNIAAFFQGVGLISAHIAAVPLDHYKRGLGRVKTALTGSKLDKLFNQAPNPEMTPFTMRETMQAHLLTWGNAYAEIEWNNLDQPIGLWPITPDRVTVYRDRESQAIRYRVAGSNGDRSVESENMFHPPGLGFDGLVGYSVIARARQSLGLSSAAERYGATFFGNGGSFGGTLTTPDDLDETQEGELRARIDRLHQGPDRAHKFLILSNGLKYEKFAIPPDDAQFLETRTFQVEEIARWLNLPPHKLKHLEHATFSNIEQQNLDYYTDTLWTWYERWEDEIRRKLIPASEWNLQFAKFNINALLRGDIKSRYDAYAVGKTAGFLSINDIHDKEDMPPVAGGDVYLQPLNMIPADQFKAYTDKQLQPPPAPAAPTPPATSEADVATANTRAALAEATAAAAREELALRRQELEDVRARPVVGAIRWDGWLVDGGVGRAVSKSLTPPHWSYRLPFFAKVREGVYQASPREERP